MSQNAQPELIDLETAGQVAFENIHAQAFFNKLAQCNIVPANESEASEYLTLGERLMQLEPQIQQKVASQRSSLVFRVNDALNSFMDEQGLNLPQKLAAAQDSDRNLLAVAAQMAQHPDLYNSIVSIKAAQAIAYAQQYSQQGAA